ncbi:MAG: RecX family transcriptional regulator [Candidatus Izemoplasmatales bacterium]
MIYQVNKIKKNKNKYILSLKHQEKSIEFEVSDEIILEFRLVKGKVLEKKDFLDLKEAIKHDNYRQKLLHYATFKARTELEASKYLDQFSIPEKAKAKYIDKLKTAKIIDDDLYTKQYIDEYSHFRMIGPNKITFDLLQKGISQSMIDRHLHQYSKQLMTENIQTLVEKKVKSSKNKPIYKIKESLKAYLVNKGYDYDLIQEIVERMSSHIEDEIDEDIALEKDYDNYLRKYKKSNQSQSFRDFILPKLMQKGYSYHKIIQILKGEEANEYE